MLGRLLNITITIIIIITTIKHIYKTINNTY